ncbi:MAG: hypothetical protein ACSHX8_13550 [Opitutaceae bacterium]
MNYKKRILQTSLIGLAIIAVTGTYLYFSLWIPNKRMADLDWMESAPREDIRKNCHAILSFKIGNHHDAFLWLAANGSRESIPLLIQALKWQPEPTEGGLMNCATAHCLDALQSLTAHNAGSSYTEWKEWWDSTG